MGGNTTSNLPPRVAISYSHDSREHQERVLDLATYLQDRGFECRIDQHEQGTPKQGWPRWMVDQIDHSQSVLVVCTELYREKFGEYSEAGGSQGVTFEGFIITNQIYAKNSSEKFPVVLFSESDKKHIPTVLMASQPFILLDGNQAAREKLYNHLIKHIGTPSPGPAPTVKRRQLFDPLDRSGLGDHAPFVEPRHFGGEDWAVLHEIFSERLSEEAMAIAALPKIASSQSHPQISHPHGGKPPGSKPHVEAGMKAVKHNLNIEEVIKLERAQNLDRFVALLDDLKQAWLERLPAEPRLNDIDKAYMAVKHGLDEQEINKLSHASDFDQFVKLLDGMKRTWLNLLPANPRLGDVENAYAKAIDAIWDHGTRKHSQALLYLGSLVAVGIAALAGHRDWQLSIFAGVFGLAIVIAKLYFLYRDK